MQLVPLTFIIGAELKVLRSAVNLLQRQNKQSTAFKFYAMRRFHDASFALCGGN